MKFKYVIKTKDGKNQKGEIEAQDQFSASKILRDQGFIVLDIKNKVSIPFLSKFKKPIGAKDKIIFAQQLAVMIKAGLPLVEALSSLEEQTSNAQLTKVITGITSDIKGGSSFSKALSQHAKVFPAYFTNVIQSGEKSGQIDQVLRQLADQMSKDYDLVSKVKGAMIYPVLILVAMLALVILIMVYIIPQLKDIFEDVGAELPVLTQIVIGMADFTKKFIVFILIAAVAAVVGFRYSIIKSAQARLYLDKLKIRLPIFGNLYRKIYMARFSRTAGTLVAAGLPILEIFKTTAGVIGNELYSRAILEVAQKVETGMRFSAAVKEQVIFPPMVGNLLSVGERSGSLDQVLFTLANFFDDEVNNITRNLTTILEPLMMLLMGIGVALIIAAVIMPIYNLVNVV